jgi:hypothetical protein
MGKLTIPAIHFVVLSMNVGIVGGQVEINNYW